MLMFWTPLIFLIEITSCFVVFESEYEMLATLSPPVRPPQRMGPLSQHSPPADDASLKSVSETEIIDIDIVPSNQDTKRAITTPTKEQPWITGALKEQPWITGASNPPPLAHISFADFTTWLSHNPDRKEGQVVSTCMCRDMCTRR